MIVEASCPVLAVGMNYRSRSVVYLYNRCRSISSTEGGERGGIRDDHLLYGAGWRVGYPDILIVG